ncbi:Myb domain containing protein [Cryptosporidium felis]|nr:Myb domain containing protein [Cryptosporidium felis]
MLNYMVGSDSTENGVICYYGEDEVMPGYPKRKFEDEAEESFEKGSRKKRYILGQNVGKWTDEEHNRFVLALKKFGRNWTLVQQEVKTRTLVQIRSHAQKYFLKKVRGIAPSNLTMDSKLISTASDGIVPTWLLQDDSNYANKTSITNTIGPPPPPTPSISHSPGMANKGSGNIGNLNLYVFDESSNPEVGIVDEPINLVNICNGSVNTGTHGNSNATSNGSNSSNSSLMLSACNSGGNAARVNTNNVTALGMDGGGIMVSNGIVEGGLGEPGALSPEMRFGGYMGGPLLVDGQREHCGYEYRVGAMDVKAEVTPKFDYKPSGGGSVPKQIMNECIFDEPYCEKRISLESTSLASTAVSSPASIGPEKNYVPASSMGLDVLLMPPTVDIKQSGGTVHSSGGGGGNCAANGAGGCGSGTGKASTGSNSNLVPDSLSYGLNYTLGDADDIINPSISPSNCDVPWPLTGCDQFIQFNERESAVSPSPSTSTSISYLDLDSSTEAKQLPPEVSASPSKHFDLGNSLSDFVYCGDSLGVDLLNIYTNLRDSSTPIINNADVTDFI